MWKEAFPKEDEGKGPGEAFVHDWEFPGVLLGAGPAFTCLGTSRYI